MTEPVVDNRIRWANYKGQKFIIANFHGLHNKDLIQLAHNCSLFILNLKQKELRILVDVTKSEDTKQAQLKFAEVAKQINPYCSKIAVIGLTPIKSIITTMITKITGINSKTFKTSVDAREWLAEN